MGTLSLAGLRDGSGRVPKSSIVLFLGVAVKATKVMPPSSARAAICDARTSSELTSPPSPSSAISSGDSSAFNLLAASPVCELCASSAMTANRFPCVAASLRTSSSANGKVWMVQTTIFSSRPTAQPRARRSCYRRYRKFSPPRRSVVQSRTAPLEVASRSRCGRTRPGRCRKPSFARHLCRSARKCAVQAMELVLPEPAEC